MSVVRVETEHGSHIEPPLDPSWSTEEKLRWHAAVVSVDAGLDVAVSRAKYETKVLGIWRPRTGDWFNVHVGSSHSAGPMDFDYAWGYLNGVSAGARGKRARDVSDPTPAPLTANETREDT